MTFSDEPRASHDLRWYRGPEGWGVWALFGFTVAAILGYAVFGLRGDLARALEEGSLPQRWDVVMGELLAAAERDYRTAFEAIPELPPFFRWPVAVAARVYQGIHEEIRRNGYDNLNRRAYTSLPRKAVLGFGGLVELRRLRRGSDAGARVPISAPVP